MKKLFVLSVIASAWLVGGQCAWADGGQDSHEDYRIFKKIVRVLDAAVNDDDCHKHGRIVSYGYRHPRKVCYVTKHHHRGHYREVCRVYRK